MKTSTKKTIGDKEYNIFMVSAEDQFKIQLRLIKAGAIPFVEALGISDDIQIIGMMLIARIMDKLDEKEIADMITTLLSTVREVGNSEPVDVNDFQGVMYQYNSLVIEALKLNFGDFIQALLPGTEVNPTPQEPESN